MRLALEQLPGLKEILRNTGGSSPDAMKELEPAAENGAASLLDELEKQIIELPELAELIGKAIAEETTTGVEGGRV